MDADPCKKEPGCVYNWAEEPSDEPGVCTHDKLFWGDQTTVELCKSLSTVKCEYN